MSKQRRRIPDGELNFIEDCLALLIRIGESWKRAVYYADNEDVLDQLRDIRVARMKLEENLKTWLEARKAVLSRDEIDYNQFHPVVREDVLDDRLKALKELFDIGFREVSELEAWVRGDDTE